jgi:4'-phosphopantetheinyl transferase
MVGVAVAEVPVGVDVEDLAGRPADPLLEAETLAPAELAMLDAGDPAQRPTTFLRLWTRKEALLKATGTGLSVPMQQVVVCAPGAPGALLPGPEPLRLWDLDPGTGFVGALAAWSESELTVSQSSAEDLLG